MSSIKLNRNSKRVLIKLENASKAIDKNLKLALYESGKELKKTANINVLKPKSGRTYFVKDRNGRRRKHVASKAGESWANLSGEARKGIFFKVANKHKLIFGNKGPKYAKFLEDGTSKMDARPAHWISLKQNKTKILNIIKQHVRKSF